jgi:hypothetical protein
MNLDGFEQEADMVAELDVVAYVSGKPAAELSQHRGLPRGGFPCATGELVDLVAGLAAEQLREFLRVVRDGMDDEGLGVAGDAIGPVLHRQAGQKAGRADRHLRGEANQTARAVARLAAVTMYSE